MLHEQYTEHLKIHLAKYHHTEEFPNLVRSKLCELNVCISLNLDPVKDILESLYDPSHQAERRDPDCMLRSLLLMSLLKYKSIDKWVGETRSVPVYTIIAGFVPGDTPGVGTYYDFMKRIAGGPYGKAVKGQVRNSKFNSHRHLRNLGEEKKEKKDTPDPHHSQSQKVAEELLADTARAREDDFQKITEDLLIRIGVIPSVGAGLMGELGKLIVSGDGSILESAASSRGKAACSCHEEGIRKCDHPRSYTSPTARWCYNHHTDSFIFGDRYYLLTTHQNGHDFPLLTIMPGGNESDYTLSLKTFDRFVRAQSENHLGIRVFAFCGDGHHDTYAHYEYFAQKEVIPVIPLSEKSKKTYPHLTEEKGIRTDTDGTPLCPAGVRMRYHGYNKIKKSHVYLCPIKKPTHRDGKYVYVTHTEECPRKTDCAPHSHLAPVVCIKSDTDPRLYPPVPRESRQYKILKNHRTATERCNSKIDSYNPDRACRNRHYGLIRLTLANIAQHGIIRHIGAVKRSSRQDVYEQFMIAIGQVALQNTG